MFALLGLSITAVSTGLALALNLGKRHLVDDRLSRAADKLWRTGKFAELRQLCQQESSALGMVILEVMRYRTEAYEHVNTVAGELASRAVRAQVLRTYPLTIAATLSPLIGLFGTVLGMIEAFDAIAGSSAVGNPAVIASGISKALTTTAAGLFVGIPALGIRHFFISRIHRSAAELETVTSDLVNRWFLESSEPL